MTINSTNAIINDYDDLLLTNRNTSCLSLIERISKDQPIFCNVGTTIHLIGNERLIKLLRTN
jgi:uncharacterized protein YbaP (TraB family)